MYKKEWNRLLDQRGMNQWYMAPIPEGHAPIRVRSTRKSDLGTEGVLVEMGALSGTMLTGDGLRVQVSFQKLELLGEAGEVVSDAPRDMLNDVLEEGAWVAYSQGRYNAGHDLEVGRIVSFTDRGMIEIDARVKSGQKIASRNGAKTISRVNPERCIKLPVDVPRMMMAIMTDFDSIDGSRD